MNKYLIIFIVILISSVAYLLNQNRQLSVKYKYSIENIKAYDAQLSGLEDNNRVFKLTINQLNYFKNFISKKMKEVQKELGIKDSKLRQLQYDLSFAQRNDTNALIIIRKEK